MSGIWALVGGLMEVGLEQKSFGEKKNEGDVAAIFPMHLLCRSLPICRYISTFSSLHKMT